MFRLLPASRSGLGLAAVGALLVLFAAWALYGLVRSPGPRAGSIGPEGPALPAPGPIPFAHGESARYRIVWEGNAAVGLPAADAVFSVSMPAPADGESARYRFDLTAETAPWVSPFFEARDRFWTIDDARLLPILHVQELREGRRQIDRAASFDHGAGIVQTADGPPEDTASGMAHPLAPWARDPVSVFYYVRTLPLAAGAVLRIPVNDLGRALAVEIRAAGPETIEAEGRAQPAMRLDVDVIGDGEGREPVSARVWVSADGRRIPLTLAIDAGFGRFRADLVGFASGPGTREP